MDKNTQSYLRELRVQKLKSQIIIRSVATVLSVGMFVTYFDVSTVNQVLATIAGLSLGSLLGSANNLIKELYG